MPSVLICAPDPLTDELHETILWRDGVERHVAARFEDALTMAVAARPDLIVVDRDLPRADRLVEDLRVNPTTRGISVVIVARGEFETGELRFLDAGANAVLRLPVSPSWDERLSELMRVPARRAARLPVKLQFEGRAAARVETVWGTIVNLSATGMLVESSTTLEMGADLDFTFRLPQSAEAVVGCGQVVRQDDEQRHGVRFYGLEGDGTERVLGFADPSLDAERRTRSG